MSPDLPEIPERRATGRVAELYADIRATLGLPIVNLVYRVLAAKGTLEPVWAELRPLLCSPGMAGLAARAVEAATPTAGVRIPPEALRAVGVDDDELERGRQTVAAYQYGNPRNLVAVCTLLAGETGLPGPASGRGGTVDEHGWKLLPMAELDRLSPPTRELLDEMSAPVAAPGDEALVPSLYRHFAHDPAWLALLWTAAAPAVENGSIGRCADDVLAIARPTRGASSGGAPAAGPPPAPAGGRVDPDTQALLERFSHTISRMVVVGALLARALGPRTR